MTELTLIYTLVHLGKTA